MQRKVLQILAMVFTVCPVVAFAQSGPPREAIDITDEDVKAVLKRAVDTKRTIPDNQIRIVDMGTYNLAVGIVHRGPTPPTKAGAALPPAPPPAERCGETPSGAPPTGFSGIAHDATVETYVVTSGGGTLITGGRIVNGRRSDPNSEVVKVLNGVSCSGPLEGNIVRRHVKPGDIIIIPENVPHGFADITDHLTYLSVRPDPKKVLQSGYVNPALKK